VNAVNPGVVITELQKRGYDFNVSRFRAINTNMMANSGMSDQSYATFLERSKTVTHPLSSSLNRCCTAREVADLCAFLASSKASYITGECIAIDGSRQNLGAR